MLPTQHQPSPTVYGAPRPVYRFFVVITLLLLLASPCRAAQDEYATILKEQAAAADLHRQRTWEVLLHYRPHGERLVSLVDDPAFFLSPQGKGDPAAELAATIDAFFQPADTGDDHPQCRFPARHLWLKEALQLDESRLPHPACTRLTEAMATIDPRSAVLIFPADHPNGPASMFGHTLLRIGSTYRSDLLGYAINYAAMTPEDNGFVYAYKGIFGLYPGLYSTLPYYEKVKEYNDLEHRDIWEYRLDLTPPEVNRLALHTWELLGIRSDYYFFDENCSFNLLFLLEAARPDLQLAEAYWNRYGFWVIPLDTIEVIGAAGLIRETAYRPAIATRIRHRAARLDGGERLAARSISRGERAAEGIATDGIPPATAQRILDVAAEYTQYRYSRGELGQEEFQRLFRATLAARSRLGAALEDDPVPQPPPPESGHPPGRITVGAGVRNDDPFLELGWRAAYHDLLDPQTGYQEGAQILFTEVAGRYHPEKDRLSLQRLRLVDIVSLAPRDEFFTPFSWKVQGGLERRLLKGVDDRLLFRINTGGGFTWRLPRGGMYYALLEGDLTAGDRLRDKAIIGLGASAGVLVRPAAAWQVHLRGETFAYGPERQHAWRLSLEQGVALGRSWSLQLRGIWEGTQGTERGEVSLGLSRYF
jgi:hypothetical protein